MLNLTSKDKPDDFEYFSNISYDKRVFFDTAKVLRTIDIEGSMALTDRELAIDSLSAGLGYGDLDIGDISKFGGSKLSRGLILDYLASELGDKRMYMMKKRDKKTGRETYSMSTSEVLNPMMDAGIAVEFLTNFIAYRKHKKAAGDMLKRVNERFENTSVQGISSLSYEWTRALSGRMYTRHDNIQNIAKLYLTAMTVPNDDYLLVWGDFDQIDLRVAYYTVISESAEDDKIFNTYDDKYEAIARIIDKRLNREFNIDNFKENRIKYKRGILARCYGQSIQSSIGTVGDKDFAKMLDEYFKANDRYTSWYDSVVSKVDSENVTVYTYFGHERNVNFNDLTTSDKKIDRLLNCPIQGTSNDIIANMVNKTVRDFRNIGVDEEKFRVYMVRHDEPIFIIHKSCLQYLYLIKRNTVIQVDDWGPITMSLDIGKYYGESQYDEYAEYFGNEDVSAGAVRVQRQDYYHPFNKPIAYRGVSYEIRYEDFSLYVNDVEYRIDPRKHIKFQVHEILASYAMSMNMQSILFSVVGDNDLGLKNIFVDGVYLNFNFVGGETYDK